MNLKDFEKGKEAYILAYGYGSRKEHIVECRVESIGTKYVTVSPYPYVNTKKFGVNEQDDMALYEKIDFGTPDLLFKKKEDLELYIERRDLRQWFSQEATHWTKCNTYSLEQLRAVKEILEGGKTE